MDGLSIQSKESSNKEKEDEHYVRPPWKPSGSNRSGLKLKAENLNISDSKLPKTPRTPKTPKKLTYENPVWIPSSVSSNSKQFHSKPFPMKSNSSSCSVSSYITIDNEFPFPDSMPLEKENQNENCLERKSTYERIIIEEPENKYATVKLSPTNSIINLFYGKGRFSGRVEAEDETCLMNEIRDEHKFDMETDSRLTVFTNDSDNVSRNELEMEKMDLEKQRTFEKNQVTSLLQDNESCQFLNSPDNFSLGHFSFCGVKVRIEKERKRTGVQKLLNTQKLNERQKISASHCESKPEASKKGEIWTSKLYSHGCLPYKTKPHGDQNEF